MTQARTGILPEKEEDNDGENERIEDRKTAKGRKMRTRPVKSDNRNIAKRMNLVKKSKKERKMIELSKGMCQGIARTR